MRIWLIITAAMLYAAQSVAGAWPREEGSMFLSFGYTLSSPKDALGDDLQGYSSTYLERGLGADLTLGVDAGMETDTDYSAIFFLRRPFGSGAGPNVFAYQGGLGLAGSAGTRHDYLLQLGASWGRGLTTPWGAGWAALDTSVQYRLEKGEIAGKADLTLGLKPTDRTKLMIQMQVGDYPGSAPYLRLVPSVARELGRGRHIELGAQFGVRGDDRLGARLGTWLEF